MTKVIDVEGVGELIVGLTEDDIKRIALDGFIAIRDDADHLLMYYHPVKNLIEIKRRGHTVTINLDKYRALFNNEVSLWNMIINHHNESATSAANQGGAHGRLTHQ